MILLLLKATLLLTITLLMVGSMQRSSAAMRHLICVCGLAGAMLLMLTPIAPTGMPVFRIASFSVSSTVRIAHRSPGWGAMARRALPWVWLAGVVVLLGRLAIGYRRVMRLTRGAGKSEIVFADVSVPAVVGLLRPVILLPHLAKTWPEVRRDAAIRHERAHVQRKDLWTLLLTHVACAVYWFHPMVWMVAAQLRREQEQACDDVVILSGFEPASYAEALIAAAQTLTSTQLMGCEMLTQKTFRSRIARLLISGMPEVSSSAALRGVALVFAGAAITIGLLNGQAQPTEPAAPQGGVFKTGGGVRAPVLAKKVDPEYTPEAKEGKVAGTVVLSMVVGTDGLAHNIRVIRGLGSGLDEKAVEALKQWRFQPGTKQGEPVNVSVNIEVNFKLL